MRKSSDFLRFSGSAGCFISKNAVLRELSYISFREKRRITFFPAYWAFRAFRGEKTAFLHGIRRFSRFSRKLMQKSSDFLRFSGSAGCFLSKNAVLTALSYASFGEKRRITRNTLLTGVSREKTAFLYGIRRFSRSSPKLRQKSSDFLGFWGSAGCFLSKNAVLRA